MKQSVATSILILLWSYAAFSKLLDLQQSRNEMLNQVFPVFISEILVWAVPVVELIVSALLLFRKTILVGLYASLFLLVSFTIYISLIITNTFGRIPCSCGGILEKLSWNGHLILNLSFIILTATALIMKKKQQDIIGQ